MILKSDEEEVKKDWYPNIRIFKRRWDPYMYQATLTWTDDGRQEVMNFYGWTIEDVQQDLEDAFEFLGKERVQRMFGKRRKRLTWRPE